MKDIDTWDKLTAEVARLERENDAIPKWIPIGERLPEADEYVLAYEPNAGGRNYHAGHNYHVVAGWTLQYHWIFYTHWMPLPDAPLELEDKT